MTAKEKTAKEKKGLNIHQRMLAVMRQIDYLQKKKEQGGPPYAVLQHDKVIEYIRGPLMLEGVYWCSSCDSMETHEAPRNGMAGTNYFCEGIITTTFFSVDNPDDLITVSAPASAVDHQDPAKAAGKMHSYGSKLTYLKALGLYTGEAAEPDIDTKTYGLDQAQGPPAEPPAEPPTEKPKSVIDQDVFEGHMSRLSAFVAFSELDSSKVVVDIKEAFGKTVREMSDKELNEVHVWCEEHYSASKEGATL